MRQQPQQYGRYYDLITNVFLYLVYNPAERANERLERTCTMIANEERLEEQHREDMELLERLDEADIKEYIKQRLFSHITLINTNPAEGGNKLAEK